MGETNTQAKDPVKRLIERRHAEYKANAEEWKFLRASVEGGPAYAAGNLFQHPLEEPAVFSARLKRAADHHHNLSWQVVSTYLGYLFQVPPTPAENLPEWLDTFIRSGDEQGRPLIELAKDVAQWQMGYGVIWLGIDKPAAPAEAIANASAAQEEEAGLLPYGYLVHPTHVLDGKIHRGRVHWLLIQEDGRDDADPLASSCEDFTRWRLWTEAEIRVIEKVKTKEGERFVITEERPNPIGRVPFIPIRYGSGTGFASPGLLADIAHLDRAVFNKASLLDEIHYSVTFPQLALPYKGELYVEGEEAGTFQLTPTGQALLTMGLHHVIPFDSEAGGPTYVTPPNGPADTLSASIDQIVRMLLGLALLDGEVSAEGEVSVASGVSKAYTFEKLNRRLATIADRLEAAFSQAFELVALWRGQDPASIPSGAWDFPDSFEVRSLAQDLADFTALMGGNVPSPTARAILWLELLRRAIPKASSKDWEDIMEEVKAATAQQDMGAIGQGMASHGAHEDGEEDPAGEREDGQEGEGASDKAGGKGGMMREGREHE